MKILFITDNFPPEVNAPATRTYEHCKEWVSQGMDVTVITCHPNFPAGKVFQGYSNKFYTKEVIDNINVIRVWSYITANEGFFKRTLDYISFGVMSFLFGLFQKYDVIIGTSPQFFSALSARWLSFFKRKPWIMEVRDLWPESIAAVGALDINSKVYKFLRWIELRLYKNASLIITVTNSFKIKIIERGINESKIQVVTNGINSEMFFPIQKDAWLLKKYNLEDKFVIGYMGTIGMAHKLDFIVNCVAKVDDNTIHFIIQGDGAERINIERLINNLDINNITFLPSVSKSEILKYLSIIDVALVNLKKSDTFMTVIPSKIFENAAMQKPILLGVQGESKEIIEKYKAGICFEPENEKQFIDSIFKIKSNIQDYKGGCKQLALDYDRKTLGTKMLNFIIKNIKK